MCFIRSKKSGPSVPDEVEQEQVVRHQADASLTKTAMDEGQAGYKGNIKTSVIGLSDDAVTNKKTLLGE